MIIDTHIHFYDTERPQGVPWPDPGDTILYRPSLPERYKALAEPAGVTGVIVVEASPWLEDNQWILDLAEGEPLVKGFVGSLDPEDVANEDHLNRFAANPLFRGIRMGTWKPTPFSKPVLDAAAKMLIDRELSLDLLARTEALGAVAALARQHPRLTIIVNHVAGVSVDGGAPDPVWISGMEALSGLENVYCKLSGMVERAAIRPVSPEVVYYRPTIDLLVETLGVRRLLYSSNWTPCERVGGYSLTLDIVQSYFAEWGSNVLERVLWRNSKAAYRWISRE